MNHSESIFKTLDNLNIYHQSWLPKDEARAVIILVHGIGEHSGRYQHVVEHFVDQSFAVYGLDHRGHGKSEGERRYISQF